MSRPQRALESCFFWDLVLWDYGMIPKNKWYSFKGNTVRTDRFLVVFVLILSVHSTEMQYYVVLVDHYSNYMCSKLFKKCPDTQDLVKFLSKQFSIHGSVPRVGLLGTVSMALTSSVILCFVACQSDSAPTGAPKTRAGNYENRLSLLGFLESTSGKD